VNNLLKQQDHLIQQIRKSEKNHLNDAIESKKIITSRDQKIHDVEQSLLEAQQEVQSLTQSMESLTKRNNELQSRCDDLVKSLENERKLR
jgi:predicted transcriptional regulator